VIDRERDQCRYCGEGRSEDGAPVECQIRSACLVCARE
jgi:hypothetical protein